MDKRQLASAIDHTLLKPDADRAGIEKLCREAVEYGFHSVCVNSGDAALCRELLAGSPVVCAVTVGFPLGRTGVECKAFEAAEAIVQGAVEVDYVVNLGRVKSGDWEDVEVEMARMTEVCHRLGAKCKVIFETCLLTGPEKERLCGIARRVRPDYVKTSTGFAAPPPGVPSGATVEDVRLMRSCVGDGVEVKASGGIRTTEQALAMLEAGAARLGTSAGPAIIDGLE